MLCVVGETLPTNALLHRPGATLTHLVFHMIEAMWRLEAVAGCRPCTTTTQSHTEINQL